MNFVFLQNMKLNMFLYSRFCNVEMAPDMVDEFPHHETCPVFILYYSHTKIGPPYFPSIYESDRDQPVESDCTVICRKNYIKGWIPLRGTGIGTGIISKSLIVLFHSLKILLTILATVKLSFIRDCPGS